MNDSGLWMIAATALLLGLVNSLLLLGLARELGVLMVRLGPSRPLVTGEGPELGSVVSRIVLKDVNELTQVVDAGLRSHLIVLVSPGCSVCLKLIEPLRTFQRGYSATTDVVVVSRSSVAASGETEWLDLRADVAVCESPRLHADWRILGTPYAVMLDRDNMVVAKGAISTLDELESLFGVDIYATKSKANRTKSELKNEQQPVG